MAASKPQARATPRSAWVEWCAQHPVLLLVLATLLALLPFLGKPFNIDDPLFIWVAQHIQSHPLDPYGFNANWYGFDSPLWSITKNPPLACYYLAAFGGVFGWSEVVLHASLFLPAVAVVLGTHRLAKHFCKRPLLAALAVLFTPVFLLSSTTVMCDVLMLAFWVWAVVFWMEGTERGRPGLFAIAAFLISLSALTKYFGACLIPLVAAWSIARKRPVAEWLGWLAVPIAMLFAYQFSTRALYGYGLLTDAGKYATAVHQPTIFSNLNLLLTALAFTGGCFAMLTFFSPLLWSRRSFLIGTGISLAGCAIALWLLTAKSDLVQADAWQSAQILFWAAGGIGLLALTITDLYRRRGADSLLLACWVLGTFVFTTFFNWVVNGRSVLPMVVPAGILLVRRLEQRLDAGIRWPPPVLFIPGLLGVVLAIWVTAGDYFFALASRKAAQVVHATYGSGAHRLWFQGHWGFQYYMQAGGATPVDTRRPQLSQGDYIATPLRTENSNIYPMNKEGPLAERSTILVPVRGCLSTMNGGTGAGFYASAWGPLPFVFGPIPAQTLKVFAYDPSGEIKKTNSVKGQ
jgi:4-amino-4-deoxy-L-arabinose transferase-like glycosyltransferase